MFYEPAVAKQCREPIAEAVRDKQRANCCDYFSPRDDAYQPASLTAAQQARAQLDALFGISSKDEAGPGVPAADATHAALNELLGGKK